MVADLRVWNMSTEPNPTQSTCSATYRKPLSSLMHSKVSPRRGLKGLWLARALLEPYAEMEKAATHLQIWFWWCSEGSFYISSITWASPEGFEPTQPCRSDRCTRAPRTASAGWRAAHSRSPASRSCSGPSRCSCTASSTGSHPPSQSWEQAAAAWNSKLFLEMAKIEESLKRNLRPVRVCRLSRSKSKTGDWTASKNIESSSSVSVSWLESSLQKKQCRYNYKKIKNTLTITNLLQ